jgi:hypothetical protein
MIANTTSPAESDEVMYVALLVPTVALFSFHWYIGALPPLVAVAVKVTGVPAQAGFWSADITTLAATLGVMFIVTAFDVAGELVAHPSDEVIATVTISPVESVLLVKVSLFVPTLEPFTFHW